MTVREAYQLLLSPKEVVVTMDGRNYDLLPEKNGYLDDMLMVALGDYVVSGIQACEEDCFAFDILMKPVKKEATA